MGNSTAAIISETSLLAHLGIIGIYTFCFLVFLIFFEMRLNTLHKHHVEKIQPIGVDGLKYMDNQLKIITRTLFAILYIVSTVLIITMY